VAYRVGLVTWAVLTVIIIGWAAVCFTYHDPADGLSTLICLSVPVTGFACERQTARFIARLWDNGRRW
jgi:hypothetical protein